jgi:hypothetical protein
MDKATSATQATMEPVNTAPDFRDTPAVMAAVVATRVWLN